MKNAYRVCGKVTKIELRGKKAGYLHHTKIDTADLDLVKKKTHLLIYWRDKKARIDYCLYRTLGMKWPRRLHRLLTKAPTGLDVDHINHDGLDNRRRKNLRVVTRSINELNRRGPQSNNSHGILGVYFHKKNMNWVARLCRETIGSFATKHLAENAVKAARKRAIGA